eukprot:scaffold203_cov32-Prasinocladus_malaysianus.AAC.1
MHQLLDSIHFEALDSFDPAAYDQGTAKPRRSFPLMRAASLKEGLMAQQQVREATMAAARKISQQ